MKRIFKCLLPLLMLFSIASVAGVSAVWNYFGLSPDDQEVNLNIGCEDFYYPENLPDDEEGELYHGALLDRIISEEDGINNPGSLLSQAIAERKQDYNNVCSNQQVKGGNLKNTFSTVEGFENVGFVIQFDSENDAIYYIYTYDNRETTNIGAVIEAYKTIAELNSEGKWVLKGGYKGTGTIIKYDGITNGKYKNIIDPGSWKPAVETN